MKARYVLNSETGQTTTEDLLTLLKRTFASGYGSTINLTINGEYYEVLQ